jgi:type II secretory pathway pseudopilin PulG
MRRAATLIELMVVVSILGTLATLLLPATQQARESSRANACRQNLHQIGLALLQYESVHKHFPKGAEGRFDRQLSPVNMFGLSWWTDTLSYLEEADVADRLDRTGANTGWAKLNTHNGEVADDFGPSIFFCPSSPFEHFVKSGDYQVACPSYTGISGATDYSGLSQTRVSTACCHDGQISARGVLIPNATIRSGRIIDGLAKTLLLGEQSDFAYTDAGQPMVVGPGFYLGGWLGGTNAVGVPPDYGTDSAPAFNLATVRYRLNERRYDLPGVYLNHGANNPLTSPHFGVVNLVHSDGSVHAVDESMDLHVLKSLATRDDAL